MKSQSKFDLMKWLHVFTWVYFTLIFAWACAHFLLGDHPWWMFALNAFSAYFFLPIPVVLLIGLRLRNRATLIATLLMFLLAFFLYGKPYLPWRITSLPAGKPITVMSYNVLGLNQHPQAVADAILASGADVVALQELNPQVAKAIEQRLSSAYPYQILDAHVGYTGSGVISRHPLQLSDERLPGVWVGTPQILSLTLDGRTIILLNAHALATNAGTPEFLEGTIDERERLANNVKDFVVAHPGPFIFLTDFNATPQSTAYKILTSVFSDAWMEAGWGQGQTFPGLSSSVPTWLVRIDYVFHSSHFRAVEAQIGPWDGYSDHRPVIARLVLTDEMTKGEK